MITIKKPYVEENESYAFLKAHIEVTYDAVKKWLEYARMEPDLYWKIDNYPPSSWVQSCDEAERYYIDLFFRVEKKYKDYLCADRADAFIAAILFYAMVCGEDIISEAPVSDEILYKCNHQLIPLLCNARSGFKRIFVHADTSVERFLNTPSGVATGMSCGVDSFASLQKHHFDDIPNKYKLTHLTYFDAGNVYRLFDEEEKDEEILYDRLESTASIKCENARKVATAVGLDFVSVYSNIDRALYRGAYMHSAVYRNCACALALQKLFGFYINSTEGFPVFYPSLKGGSAEYELAILNSFSNKNLEFLLGCIEQTRFERTEKIADNPIVQQNLDVCWNFSSCGVCGKCYRTQLTLEVLGKLDLFKNVFDVEKYNKNRKIAYAWLLHYKKSAFNSEIIKEAKRRNVKIPKISYLISIIYTLLDFAKPVKRWFVKVIKHRK